MTDRSVIGWLLPAGVGLALVSFAGLFLAGKGTSQHGQVAAPVISQQLALGSSATKTVVASAEPGVPVAAPSAPAPVDVAAVQRLQSFLQRLEPEARDAGISTEIFRKCTRGLSHDEEVLTLSRGQPEHVIAPWDYMARVVSPTRIEGGRLNLARQTLPLAIVEARSGVDRYILTAIWGIESNYGSAQGERPVLRSLATLAANDARRGAFWKGELIAAMLMVERGEAMPEQMIGSWAGAMGQTQFMPSTFRAYAVDFDGDGRRDIWGNPADGLASAGNYLKVSGWRPGVGWGFEVALPRGFDLNALPPGSARPFATWRAAGVQPVKAPRFEPAAGDAVMLLLPGGITGPAFLVTANFDAILRYNNSVSYALSVGHLADRIAGEADIVGRWPTEERPVARAGAEELQRRLAVLGFDAGTADGLIGNRTRSAVRAYQSSRGRAPDGFVTERLLERLRGEPLP